MTDPETTAGRDQLGWRFLYSPRWIGYFVLLVIFSIACVLLGNWQFERRAEARAEIDRIDANYDADAVPLESELTELDTYDNDAQKWLTVETTGEYVGEPFLARNRPGPQGSGSDVIQAFRTDEGTVFFIDRGWVPVDSSQSDEAALAELPEPAEGELRIEARLREGEPPISGRASAGRTVASIDLPELARLADEEGNAYVGAYGMLVSEDPAGEHGTLPDKPERDEGPHLSYALQWYIFIIIAFCGVGYAANREYRGLNVGSSRVAEQDRRSAERKERRGLSDAEEEDALLDA